MTPPQSPPDTFLLLRLGENDYTVNGTGGTLHVNESDIDRLIAEFERRGKDLVIDYEHQTLNGTEAPAAGWIASLSKTADGLVAQVRRWTERAVRYLENGEYRYFSPVVFSLNGHPAALHSVALTNHPAIHGVAALAASDLIDPVNEPPTPGVHNMETLRTFAAALGMVDPIPNGEPDGEGRLENAVLEECRTLRQRADEADAFLKLHECPDFDSLTLKIKGLIAPEVVAELHAKLAEYDAGKAVEQAFTDGKLTEAQRPWANAYARKDLAAFSDFIAKSPVVTPGSAERIPLHDGFGIRSVAFGETELRVLRASGASETQIQRIKQGE